MKLFVLGQVSKCFSTRPFLAFRVASSSQHHSNMGHFNTRRPRLPNTTSNPSHCNKNIPLHIPNSSKHLPQFSKLKAQSQKVSSRNRELHICTYKLTLSKYHAIYFYYTTNTIYCNLLHLFNLFSIFPN